MGLKKPKIDIFKDKAEEGLQKSIFRIYSNVLKFWIFKLNAALNFDFRYPKFWETNTKVLFKF